jgi:hypothetical protein
MNVVCQEGLSEGISEITNLKEIFLCRHRVASNSLKSNDQSGNIALCYLNSDSL